MYVFDVNGSVIRCAYVRNKNYFFKKVESAQSLVVKLLVLSPSFLRFFSLSLGTAGIR